MAYTTTLQPKPFSIPDGRPKRSRKGREPGKKPKNVNSETRKQQNRIASRNYSKRALGSTVSPGRGAHKCKRIGEKRKRNLQYLQQLLKGEDLSEQQEPPTSLQQLEEHTRPCPTDYEPAVPSSSHSVLPSNGGTKPFGWNSATTRNAVPTASTEPLENLLFTSTSLYPAFEQSWNESLCEQPHAVNIIAWNIPPWMLSTNCCPPPLPSRPDIIHHTSSSERSSFVTPPKMAGRSVSHGALRL